MTPESTHDKDFVEKQWAYFWLYAHPEILFIFPRKLQYRPYWIIG